MKLIIGQKYNLSFKPHNSEVEVIYYGVFYMGISDLNGYENIVCNICGKNVMKYPHVFRLPVNGASYDEAKIMFYDEELNIGSSCIQKIKIEESVENQMPLKIFANNVTDTAMVQ